MSFIPIVHIATVRRRHNWTEDSQMPIRNAGLFDYRKQESMTKTEARKLIKQKATTRLKAIDVSLLHHLINAVFLGQGEGAKNHDVASRPANISIQTLAAKSGLKTE